MIDQDDLFVVTKKEVHFLPQCPCPVCAEERARRAPANNPTKSIRTIPLDAASALRLVKRRPAGSLARELSSSK